MQINRLRLQDFGPHSGLDVKTDASIVGLMGPNGSGKSNILEAIKIGFSSTSTDKLDSYIRNGCDTAVIDIDFSKNKEKGRIYRKIGKSPKRILEWRGKKYTKASEIEETIRGILGADKSVLSNAVFVSQGYLDKLLFGTQAEREELFSNMMLLSHFGAVSDVADGKIRSISSTVQDFSVLEDEIKIQIDKGEESRAITESKLRNTADKTSELKGLRDLKELLSDIDRSRVSLSDCSQQIAQTRQAITSLLQQFYNGGSREELTDDITKRTTTAEQARSKLLESKSTQAIYREWSRLVDDLDKYALELSSLTNTPNVSSELISMIDKQYQFAVGIDSQRKELESTRIKLEDNKFFWNGEAEASLKDLESEITDLEAKQEVLVQDLEFHKIKNHTMRVLGEESQNHECPVCASKLPEFTPEMRNQCAENLARVKADVEEIKETIQQKRSEATRLSKDITSWTEYANAYKSKAEALPKSGQSVEELKSTLDTLRDSRDLALKTQATKKSLEQNIELTKTRLAEFSADEVDKVKSFHPQDLESAQKLFDDTQIKLSDILDLEQKIKELEDTIVFKTEQLQEADKKLKELKVKYESSTFVNLGISTIAQVDEAIAEAESHQAKYNQLLGELAQAESYIAGQMARYHELDARRSKEETKQLVISGLRKLKEAFSRTGITRNYISYKYRKLVSRAQDNLSEMDANFSIRSSLDKPVSLEFCRNDDPDSVYMDQSKLSGGQRVRVSIAILMAIQQALIPELGFLVLDEPSMHVEESGVHALKDLFLTLGARMANNDSQIWISDHHEVLATAFGATINLK